MSAIYMYIIKYCSRTGSPACQNYVIELSRNWHVQELAFCRVVGMSHKCDMRRC